MVSDIAYIFHIYIPEGKSLSLVAMLKSSFKVEVKSQGHNFLINGRCGDSNVLQTHLVLFLFQGFVPSAQRRYESCFPR